MTAVNSRFPKDDFILDIALLRQQVSPIPQNMKKTDKQVATVVSPNSDHFYGQWVLLALPNNKGVKCRDVFLLKTEKICSIDVPAHDFLQGDYLLPIQKLYNS